MSYNYEEEFKKAIQNTKNENINIDNIEFNNHRYFNNNLDLFSKNIISTLMWLKDKKKVDGVPEYIPLAHSIIANCGPFHNYMKPIIEKALGCKSFLTLGYIRLEPINGNQENLFHKFEIEDIKNAILNKNSFPSNHHIWLTLDSGEILDMTFLMTYSSIVQKDTFEETIRTKGLPLEFINKHYSELSEGMEYKPLFVGEEILIKSNYNLKSLTNITVWDKYPESI